MIELLYNPHCEACPLGRNPRVAHRCIGGKGLETSRILLIGEAPGRFEDREGVPFVGAAGEELDRLLKEIGLSDRVFITNVVKCRPPLNMNPTSEQMTTCSDLYLYPEIRAIKPAVIVTLGLIATSQFDECFRMRSAKFHHIEVAGVKFTLIPSWHPSFVMRQRAIGDTKPYNRLRDDLLLAKGLAGDNLQSGADGPLGPESGDLHE